MTLWFIFLRRSIDFLLFSLPLIPGSVSSVALYRRAIIRGLITAPLAAYLLPGDSLFKPLPNDLGKLTCSTSQDCEALLMSEGVAPTQELWSLPKKEGEARKGPGRAQLFADSPGLPQVTKSSTAVGSSEDPRSGMMMMSRNLSLRASHNTFRARTKASCVFIYQKRKGPCLHPNVLRWPTLRYIQFIFFESNETAEVHLSG